MFFFRSNFDLKSRPERDLIHAFSKLVYSGLLFAHKTVYICWNPFLKDKRNLSKNFVSYSSKFVSTARVILSRASCVGLCLWYLCRWCTWCTVSWWGACTSARSCLWRSSALRRALVRGYWPSFLCSSRSYGTWWWGPTKSREVSPPKVIERCRPCRFRGRMREHSEHWLLELDEYMCFQGIEIMPVKMCEVKLFAPFFILWSTILIFRKVNKKFIEMSRVQCLEAAVSADKKFQKASGQRGSSHAANHPFDGKAYVQARSIYPFWNWISYWIQYTKIRLGSKGVNAVLPRNLY